jgi:hypothetical protein
MTPSGKRDENIPKVDRRGTTVLVPLGISAVFAILAALWVSMAGHEDRSTAKDVLTRPNAPPAARPGG